MSQTRRLAAILAADVAGYSRLMGADERPILRGLSASAISPPTSPKRSSKGDSRAI